MNRALTINYEIADLQKQFNERINALLSEQRAWLEQDGNDLKLPKQQESISLETIVSSIYEAYPETRGFNSKRLLAYIKDFAMQQNIAINVKESRIRQLEAWRKRHVDRESGNTRYGYNLDTYSEKYCD